MKFLISIFAISVLMLLSCNKYLKPDKEQSDLLTAVYKDAQNIYTFMDGGNRQFSTYEAAYNSVGRGLDSLFSRDLQRNSNTALLVMDRALIKGWGLRMGYHKGRGTLTAKEVNQERLYTIAYFDPRIRAEESIK